MGKHTGVAWADHTFNGWWGCCRVSRECRLCYAETWARRCGFDVWGKKAERRQLSDAYWREPLRWNREAEAAGVRRRVFCASMADVFEDHPELPPLRERLWELITATPGLDWLLLTKRPENMRQMAPWTGEWPAHVWPGTSIGVADSLPRLEWLLRVPAREHFVSAEPLVEPVRFDRYMVEAGVAGHCVDIDGGRWHAPGTCRAPECGVPEGPPRCCRDRISWIIVGGESGARDKVARLDPGWALDIKASAEAHDVRFFFKQAGTALAAEWGCTNRKGEEPAEWPEEFRVQQVPGLVRA